MPTGYNYLFEKENLMTIVTGELQQKSIMKLIGGFNKIKGPKSYKVSYKKVILFRI